MTRIIAGRVGGRTIATPRGPATRPTTDRVREALFSRVEALLDISGARVLDLYAGSGALGLEAASRGAAHVLAVEKHQPTAALLDRNVRELGLGRQVQVRIGPVERVLHTAVVGEPYDLVLADPPYALSDTALAEVLGMLVSRGWLRGDALVVVERSARSPRPPWPVGLSQLRTRTYGETALHLAEPTGGPAADDVTG